MTGAGPVLAFVAVTGFALLIWAITRGGDEDDTRESDDEQAHSIGLYDWQGNPTEGQHYVLVDLSDDGRQAL